MPDFIGSCYNNTIRMRYFGYTFLWSSVEGKAVDAIDTLVMILFFIGCTVLGLMVLKCVVVGAKCQFAWTKEKGVFSLILFFTAWILLFKPMAAWAFVLGFNKL